MEDFIKNMESIVAEQNEIIDAFVRTISGIDPATQFSIAANDVQEFEPPRQGLRPIPVGAFRA
jgi:hypothetical protein